MNPSPTDWHREPKAFTGPCPVCGCPTRRPGEHRAVAEAEGLNARWILRHKTPRGWKHTAIVQRREAKSRAEPGPKPRGKPGPKPGPAPKTMKRLMQAANLVVQGSTLGEAGEKVGMLYSTLRDRCWEYSAVWQAALDGARGDLENHRRQQEKVIEEVRKAARSQAVPLDAAGYLRTARLADRWAKKLGTELFPSNGKTTLATFYREWCVPNRLADASPLTKETFEATLSRWRLLVGDPPLNEIAAATLTKFRDSLATCRVGKGIGPMSPTTVARHLRHVNILLNKAGPPGYRNRDAAGLIPGPVPWVKSPRMVVSPPRIVTDVEISACYDATALMDQPRGLPYKPGDWWRALLVLAWNSGLRAGTIFSLCWEDLAWDRRCLAIPPKRMKSRRWQITPLNGAALEHLRKIRQAGGLVFPWPFGRGVFYRHFHKLQAFAAIPRDQRFGLHAIRKTLATRLWGCAPEAAVLALGHTGADVTLKHYVQGPIIVAQAVERLPQPEAFRRGTPAQGAQAVNQHPKEA